MRYFRGRIGGGAAESRRQFEYGVGGEIAAILSVRNAGSQKATVTVLDAYSGENTVRALGSAPRRIVASSAGRPATTRPEATASQIRRRGGLVTPQV
jgi:hypothetical protein